ncbi:HEAT repeat-containing protein 3 [Leptopilina boulardi]|uniref:HEAT repeat-containing protein 3 n=1 Tax=Leptopilina boulardi TaxID=63433 RepID=UPI0021F5FB91|nr:HEAT repeat-containing protein 3 [Leptopilina boulardi]
MGKQKRQRHKQHKQNPTGLISEKDFDEELEDVSEETKEKALLRVMEQLSSADMEEKMSGLQTLESMSYEESMAVKIAKDNIAKIVGPYLVDENKLVRAAAASTLRIIAENGGEEAYTCLLKDDLMTPLTALLKNHYLNWHPSTDPKEKEKVEQEKQIFVEAVTLLWTLGEKNECVIKRSNEENLLSILIKFLDTSTYGIRLSIVAIQCMLTLSEDNPTAILELKKQESTLINYLDWKPENENIINTMSLRTLAAGLLMNINNSFTTEIDSLKIASKVVTILTDTLTLDYQQQTELLTKAFKNEKNLTRNSRKNIREINQIASIQQQALEILANLCTDDQESDEESDFDDSDEYEEEMDIDPMEDKSINSYSNIPVELIEVIASTDLVKKVWSKTEKINENVIKTFDLNPEGIFILKRLRVLRCRAFLCLNNLFSSLDVDTLGGVDNLYRLWSEIGKVVFTDADPNDIDLLESATSAMRAALQKLAEVKANVFQQLSVVDLQPMCNGERQCSNANVRANLLRILGNLALILLNVQNPQSLELIKHISVFLLETCTKENEVWVIAESLDAIMDIFAEDETDTLAKEINLVEKLKSFMSILKNKIRQQKQKLGDNASVVSTVKTNLNRFIKYKGQRVAQL